MNITKAFLFSVFSVLLFTGCQNSTKAQSSTNPTPENTNEQIKVITESETPEQKAIRLAEEFIKRNGYTNEPADKEGLSYETIEISGDKDEILKLRKNSLQSEAYSVFERAKENQKGWTVAFRYNKNYLDKVYRKDSIDKYNTLGRSVTMDEKFENLRVEHESIFLNKLEKNLQ